MRSLLCLWLLAGAAFGDNSVYREDVAFFLNEFEEKAGHFFEEKGVDWESVRKWAEKEVAGVESDAEHRRLCSRLVARLRDGHARLTDCRVEWPGESEGRTWRFPKVGMVIAERRLLVNRVDPDLGIPFGSEVLRVDGANAVEWLRAKADEWSDRRGYSTRRHVEAQVAAFGLAGWEGTEFQLTLRKPDGGEFSVKVDRSLGEKAPVSVDGSGQLGEFFPVERNGCAKTKAGNGYIRLRNVPKDLPEQLDRMLVRLGDVPGMILDMRGNSGGGCDHYAVFARFLKKGEFWGAVEGKGERPYPGPLVVIVDAMTASAGETLSGQFGEDQRALVTGPCGTAGMSSQKVTIKASSGLCGAYFSVRSNKGRFNDGKGIEGIGVIPHVIVAYEPEDLRAGIDTQIRRAEEFLKKGVWEEYIDYDGTKFRAEK